MKNLILISLVLVSTCIYAQNTGYMGKKNLVELNLITYIPVLSNYSDATSSYGTTYYKNKNGSLVNINPMLKVAFSLSAVRSISKRLCLGLEIGRQQLHLKTDEYYTRYFNNTVYNVRGKLENLDANHFFILPKIEFTKKNGIFGIGMSNQIGFGIGRTTFLEKDYLFDMRIGEYNSGSSSNMTEAEKQDFKTNMLDYSNAKFKNFIFLYALTFRKAITKELSLNYGFRYTLNIINKPVNSTFNNNNFWVDQEEILNNLKSDRLLNIIQFKIGLTYFF